MADKRRRGRPPDSEEEKGEKPPPKEGGKEAPKKAGGISLDPSTWSKDFMEVAEQEGGEIIAKRFYSGLPWFVRQALRQGGAAGRGVLNLFISRIEKIAPVKLPRQLRLEIVSTLGRLAQEESEGSGAFARESKKPEDEPSPEYDYSKVRTTEEELTWMTLVAEGLEADEDLEALEWFRGFCRQILASRSGGGPKKEGQKDGGHQQEQRRRGRRQAA